MISAVSGPNGTRCAHIGCWSAGWIGVQWQYDILGFFFKKGGVGQASNKLMESKTLLGRELQKFLYLKTSECKMTVSSSKRG